MRDALRRREHPAARRWGQHHRPRHRGDARRGAGQRLARAAARGSSTPTHSAATSSPTSRSWIIVVQNPAHLAIPEIMHARWGPSDCDAST
ncbi:MAG: hypothetical protein IPN47_10465 [Gemmatimonadetes bacterium]|nr:hypothetical protein [Gemmatimonadota bacterium]